MKKYLPHTILISILILFTLIITKKIDIEKLTNDFLYQTEMKKLSSLSTEATKAATTRSTKPIATSIFWQFILVFSYFTI